LEFKVIVTSEVREEILNYIEYIADRGNPNNAVTWALKMEEAVLSLSEFPERFPIYVHPNGSNTPFRWFVLDSHRVLYYIDHENKQVLVTTVQHTALDY